MPFHSRQVLGGAGLSVILARMNMPAALPTLPDLIGLIGVALSIGCYARLQWQRDFAKRMIYSVLNALASVLIIISLMYSWNLSAFVINVCWGLISCYGIYRCSKYIIRDRRKQQQTSP